MKSRQSTISHDNVRKAKQTVKLLLARPDFRLEAEKLRVKWEVDRGNPKRDENMKRLELSRVALPVKTEKGFVMGDYPTMERCYKDLVDLMAKFGLDSQYWIGTLWEYIRTGKFDEESLAFNLSRLDSRPIVRFEIQPITKKRKVIIELGDNTTLKDVKAAWHEVEEVRKQLHLLKPKFKEWKNFERDQRAYQLATQGKTIVEIDKALREEYGADLDYGNIKKIVSTYRKRLGLPKSGKLITSSTKVNKRRLLR